MGLTNTQYDEIMRDYERRQNQVRQELSAREREAYRRIPELRVLDAEIAAAGTACARAILDPASEEKSAASALMEKTVDPAPVEKTEAPAPMEKTEAPASEGRIADLRTRISRISSRKARLLREAGFPDDYLLPRYHCPDCQDTGYIGSRKCHCFRQAEIDLLYAQSNLRDVLREEDFSAFSLNYYSETMTDSVTGLTAAQMAARALSECERFVREFDAEAANLFLSGDTGLGKTFLSHCVANALLESTHSVIYFSAFRLFELLADSSFGRTGEGEAEELNRHIFECDLLIVDDLGTEMVNSFVASELFLVLNERILRRKSTLISTNLSLSAIADRYSERVLSRISSSYRMLRLIGDDIRIQKRLKERG